MNAKTVYVAAQIAAVIISAVTALWIFRMNPEKLSKVEPLPRNRTMGGVLGLIALLWCIPHARPIAFDWMQPCLLWIAIGGAVAGYLFLDYLFSRAVGGLFILIAYYFVHCGFEFHALALPFVSVMYWILGIIGICFSGKPCYMRDLLRKCCRDRRYRITTGVYFAILSLTTLAVLIAGEVF